MHGRLDTLTPIERERWQQVFNKVLAETNDDLLSEMAAWGALRKARMVRATKSADGVIIDGWAVYFGDVTDTDLSQTYFDENTQYLTEYYQNAPLFFDHGDNPQYGIKPIGKRIETRVYPFGIALKHVLHSDHPLHEETVRRIEKGELSYSSDTIYHYMIKGFDFEDRRYGMWSLAACSLTANPAEPALGAVTFADMQAAVKSARSQTILQGEQQMNILQMLADFFGVSAEIAAVKSAGDAMVAQLNEEEAPDGAQSNVDMAALAAALGLAADATPQDVAARLQMVLDSMMQPDAAAASAAPAPVKSHNYEALAAVVSQLAQNAPAQPSAIPFAVPVAQKNAGSKPTRHNVNFNRGAQKPGIATMLADIKAGKSVSYQTGPTGGHLLNHEVSDELIPVLRDKLVLDMAGAQRQDMQGIETLTIPKMTADAEAYWVGEGTTIPESDLTAGVITLVPKPIAARVPVPNKFLSNSAYNYENQVRESILYRIARLIDRTALLGTGGVTTGNTGAEPLGLINTTGVTSTSLGANGATPSLEDLTAAELRLAEANIESSDTWGWIFSPRTKKTFTDLTDLNGNPLIRQSWVTGAEKQLIGYPYHDTTLIPNTVTTGSNANTSYIFFGDWKYMVIGISNQIEFMVNPYRLSHQLQTEITAYTYVDIAVHYTEAFEVITGVAV